MCSFPRLTAALLVVAFASPLRADSIPSPFNTETATTAPMPGAEVAAKMQLPPGFHATLFAGEPEVQQPISMTTDSRGRLWVAENYTYAERQVNYEPKLRDRILVFEDTDNDGRYDKRTVFWEGANRLISIEVGDGGIWALTLPELVFIPDRNHDDVPDGPPVTMLDGFDIKGRHTMANGLRWGPDGWLYGRQGILTTSLVGKPGAPESERTTINVGIWRFRPGDQRVEVVAQGTTNPWGMDWDENGEAFFINTVIGHLWHVIPGAHYRRMTGDDLDPRIYEVIEQHADHVHWATKEDWTDVRKGVSDATLAAGGGHAHTGLLIYQGGVWPSEWAGKLLTINFHGKRFNVERLEREGTGYVGRREPEAFFNPDPWFRGIDLIPAPDGNIFLSDWSDTGECHDHDGVHRTSGRIYKISYGDPKPLPYPDLAKLSGPELAQLQLSPNVWLSRMSRRILAARHPEDARPLLESTVATASPVFTRLNALWSLQVMGALTPAHLTPLLVDPDEHLRAWSLRLLEDQHALSRAHLPALAAQEKSGLVRLTLASLLQKLPLAERPALAAALLAHAEDNGDHNQPDLIWCGILDLAELPGDAFTKLIAEARQPRVQRFGARRLAELLDQASEKLNSLISLVSASGTPEARQALLDGMADGFSGRRQAPKPAAWDGAQKALAAGASQQIQDRLRDLSALFGDGLALDAMRDTALKATNSFKQRRAALQALIEARAPALREVCERLLPEREFTLVAAQGLSIFDDPAIADRLLAVYPQVPGADRTPYTSLIFSRPSWIPKALDAIKSGTIEREKLTALLMRQIRGYKDPALTKRLDDEFGKAPEPAAGKAAFAKWKQRLTPALLAQARPDHGHQLFLATCAACHTLNGEGAQIGPDLTGASRDNLDYLLDNILTPSAVVADDFRQNIITLQDGRVLAGFVKAQTERTLKVQTVTETLSLEKSEIKSREISPLSLMPEGQLDALPEQDARDLIAYLMKK